MPFKGIDPIGREISERVAGSEPTRDHEAQEFFFLLPDEIKETLSTPLKAAGFPIDDKIGKVLDPSGQPHHHYRSYVEEGYLAYLYFGNGLLQMALQARNWYWIGYILAKYGARGIYFFSDVKRIAEQFIDVGEEWKNQLDNLEQVRFFTKQFIPDLKKEDVEIQIQLVKDRFGLDRFKSNPKIRSRLTWIDLKQEGEETNKEKECVINIIANQASHAPSVFGPKGYLSNAISKTRWPDPWKEISKGGLKGIPAPDAREVFDYALSKGSLKKEPLVTALGNLLEQIMPDLGREDCTTIKDFIAKYNLTPIRD